MNRTPRQSVPKNRACHRLTPRFRFRTAAKPASLYELAIRPLPAVPNGRDYAWSIEFHFQVLPDGWLTPTSKERSPMPVLITPIYAALIALLLTALSIRVISYRRANTISLGDSGDKALLKRMRAQANCAEYAPIGIILLLLTEIAGAPGSALHLLGLLLLAGRVLHAIGFSATPQKMILRQIGMFFTFSVIFLTSLGLIGHALF